LGQGYKKRWPRNELNVKDFREINIQPD